MAPMAAPSGGMAAGGGLVGGVGSSLGATAGGALGGAGSTLGGVGGAVGAAGQTTLGSQSSTQLSTPLRSLHVSSSAGAQSQGGFNSMLSTRQSDLRLESGTQMRFRVAGNTPASRH